MIEPDWVTIGFCFICFLLFLILPGFHRLVNDVKAVVVRVNAVAVCSVNIGLTEYNVNTNMFYMRIVGTSRSVVVGGQATIPGRMTDLRFHRFPILKANRLELTARGIENTCFPFSIHTGPQSSFKSSISGDLLISSP